MQIPANNIVTESNKLLVGVVIINKDIISENTMGVSINASLIKVNDIILSYDFVFVPIAMHADLAKSS